MAYSSGFNPHPRISFAGAAPTGSASEAEYLEIGLAKECDPAEILTRLDQVMPDGLDLVEVAQSEGGSLADRLEASRWRIDLEIEPSEATRAADALLAAEEVAVERMTKKGLRRFDVRSAVVALTAGPGERGSSFDLVLRHGTPSVRPDDVLSGLVEIAGLQPGEGVVLTRLTQGPLLADGLVGDPLAPTVG